jgi:hypothetical protein
MIIACLRSRHSHDGGRRSVFLAVGKRRVTSVLPPRRSYTECGSFPSLSLTPAQRRALASPATSVPGRACSVARAGSGRTETCSASATGERPNQDRALTFEAGRHSSAHMKLTMHSFRTRSVCRSAAITGALAKEAEQHLGVSGIRFYGACAAYRCGSGGKSFSNPQTRSTPALS